MQFACSTAKVLLRDRSLCRDLYTLIYPFFTSISRKQTGGNWFFLIDTKNSINILIFVVPGEYKRVGVISSWFDDLVIKKNCIFAALKEYRCIHEGTICPLFYY